MGRVARSRAALQGWRVNLGVPAGVRNKGWPDTLAEEAIYDFCMTQDFICPMNEDAAAAVVQLIDQQSWAETARADSATPAGAVRRCEQTKLRAR